MTTIRSRQSLISIHALREEGDPECLLSGCAEKNFYPRPPRGGRPYHDGQRPAVGQFLSTPSARRATPSARPGRPGPYISIHALREEGDLDVGAGLAHSLISIHALREEGDRPDIRPKRPQAISIHALREEGDPCTPSAPISRGYFYPRPPRGGRQPQAGQRGAAGHFYPRPPRGGRQQKQRQNLYFQTNYTTFCTNLEEL